MSATIVSEPRAITPSSPAPAPRLAGLSRSLHNSVLRGSFWTVGGFFASQALRLANNLVLTRLLAPEIFGITSLVYVFLQALEMCSDLGVGPSIVRDRRGDDRAFLDTAWTIQAARGVALWLGSVVVAWPLALLYGKPELAWLLPVAGLGAVTQGLTPTAVAGATRHMALARLTLFEFAALALSLALVTALAFFWPTVWAVVVGSAVGGAGRLVLAHLMIPGARNRHAWDRAAAAALIHFGKWLTLSTLLSYVCLCGDRLILGYVMSSAELGVYAIAFTLAQVVPTVVGSVGSRVFFPLFARVWSSGETELGGLVRRLQCGLLAVALPPIWLLVACGPRLIESLYDRRYHAAGPMLSLLGVGAVVPVLTASVTPMLLALGNSRLHMVLLAFRAAALLACMALGGWAAGLPGLLIGIVAGPVVCYPATAWVASRHGAWAPLADLVALSASAAVFRLCL